VEASIKCVRMCQPPHCASMAPADRKEQGQLERKAWHAVLPDRLAAAEFVVAYGLVIVHVRRCLGQQCGSY
jgi:hypothetical protein